MTKVWLVLLREFRSTVLTKAFLLGAFVLPVVIYGLMIAIPMLVKPEIPILKGRIALVDETGIISPLLVQQFSPEFLRMRKEAIQEITEEDIAQSQAMLGDEQGEFTRALLPAIAGRQLRMAKEQPIPEVEFELISPDAADIDALKSRIRAGELIAAIHIRADALKLPDIILPSAVAPQDNAAADSTQPEDDAESTPAAVTIYTEDTMHGENSSRLYGTMAETIIAARVVTNNFDAVKARQVMARPSVDVTTVTETGETQTSEAANIFAPIGFMMLLWISTFTGGQFLLTSTIEEKASRVMEVLLSATSALQLMTGKILGQGAVALTMMTVYAGLAIAGVHQMEFGHLIPTTKILLVIPYFIMAFFIIACIMASIGSAVSEMRDAQALMGPVIMVLMLPMVALIPIVRGPNSTFSVACSFFPPATPFVMALRLGGNQPIPVWQIIATMVLGFAVVIVGVWATSKIFRIGVLMYGKPPTFMTLIKWIAHAPS